MKHQDKSYPGWEKELKENPRVKICRQALQLNGRQWRKCNYCKSWLWAGKGEENIPMATVKRNSYVTWKTSNRVRVQSARIPRDLQGNRIQCCWVLLPHISWLYMKYKNVTALTIQTLELGSTPSCYHVNWRLHHAHGLSHIGFHHHWISVSEI